MSSRTTVRESEYLKVHGFLLRSVLSPGLKPDAEKLGDNWTVIHTVHLKQRGYGG